MDQVRAGSDFDFINMTGMELTYLLACRTNAQLAGKKAQEQFMAKLGASLILVADTLRGPIEAVEDRNAMAERLIGVCNQWIRNLLEPSLAKK
jgi:hypothetical protein